MQKLTLINQILDFDPYALTCHGRGLRPTL